MGDQGPPFRGRALGIKTVTPRRLHELMQQEPLTVIDVTVTARM
jgi:hypothetical protein